VARRPTTLYLDDEILEAARALAARTERDESDVVEDAVRSYLGLDVAQAVWQRSDLSEEQAPQARRRRKARRASVVARAVFDPTSSSLLLISPRGAPAALYLALTRGRFQLIASPQLLNELDQVLTRSKFRRYASREEARAFVDAVARLAVLTEDPPTIPGRAVSRGLTRERPSSKKGRPSSRNPRLGGISGSAPDRIRTCDLRFRRPPFAGEMRVVADCCVP